MKIATVTPNRPYELVDPDGKVTHVVQPGELLPVVGTRTVKAFDILVVEYRGKSFGIPEADVIICEELELV